MRQLRMNAVFLALSAFSFSARAVAQNPLIMDQYTADPTARVFEGKIYVYPSHDILASPGKGRAGWFCMADYHVFSSHNLTEWTDHGVIVSQDDVPWVDSTSYSMWAPDCVRRDGKYYFYFPARMKPREQEKRREGGIGVGVADAPCGPFVFEPKPIEGVFGIDPCVFIDTDGQAYLYWAGGGLSVAKLTSNMRELASKPEFIEGLHEGFKEGPFMFERKGIYYLTYPNVIDSSESLVYSTADNPLGPFTYGGVIMERSPTGCWTNHHSIVDYNGQWLLFYHHNDLSPDFDKARSIRADSLFFNEDGAIKKVTPTLRGVGLTQSSARIQIDRYSARSERGVSVDFIDSVKPCGGWKIGLSEMDAWVRYNAVDFGRSAVHSLKMRAVSPTGGTVDIRLDAVEGPLLARVAVGKTTEWNVVETTVATIPSGTHNIVTVMPERSIVVVDWITFTP